MRRCLDALGVIALVASAIVHDVAAFYPGPGPNGLEQVPTMGWMSWQQFRCEIDCATHPTTCISEQLYVAMADRMANDGWLAAGYDTLSIDDCWASATRVNGELVADAQRFPHGMKWLVDYVHSRGLKFGIYTDEGNLTCGGYPGSLGHEQIDARTFASWNVDYVKVDGCYNTVAGYGKGYPKMGFALQATGRNMTYSCSWPAYLGDDERKKPFAAFVAAGCNSWRNWDDVENTAASVLSIVDHFGNYSDYLQRQAAPGRFNDMDQLIAGSTNGGQTLPISVARLQLAVWTVAASPMFMSNDLRIVDKSFRDLLTNAAMIEIVQDPLGFAGRRVRQNNDQELWARPLATGSVAVALINRTPSGTHRMTFNFTEVGLIVSPFASAYDVFGRQGLGTFKNTLTYAIPAIDGALLILKPL